MRRTITLLAAACLALAGCSSSDSDGDKPAKPTPAASETPTLSAEEQVQACVDAVAADPDGAEENRPAECAELDSGEWLDALFDGTRQANEANRREIAECVEDPTCTSVPIP
jgi:outer membrane murein-binding lipoprotein Lpp